MSSVVMTVTMLVLVLVPSPSLELRANPRLAMPPPNKPPFRRPNKNGIKALKGFAHCFLNSTFESRADPVS